MGTRASAGSCLPHFLGRSSTVSGPAAPTVGTVLAVAGHGAGIAWHPSNR